MTPEIEQFGKCLYATDCLMDTNMRSFLNEDNAVGTCVEIKFWAPHAIDATVNLTHWLISTQVATFIHQMVPSRRGNLGRPTPSTRISIAQVPHHNNAVNMAKILLKMDVLDADDEDDAGMIDMLWTVWKSNFGRPTPIDATLFP